MVGYCRPELLGLQVVAFVASAKEAGVAASGLEPSIWLKGEAEAELVSGDKGGVNGRI